MTNNKLFTRHDNPSVLNNLTVAVIGGFNERGHAHVNNLIDNGVEVIVGAKGFTEDWVAAKAADLTVMTPGEAARRASVVVVLGSEILGSDVFKDEISPNLQPGTYLGFTEEEDYHENYTFIQGYVNVFIIIPESPELVRSEFEKGKGVPAVVKVKYDFTGRTRDYAFAYAAAIGAGRKDAGITVEP